MYDLIDHKDFWSVLTRAQLKTVSNLILNGLDVLKIGSKSENISLEFYLDPNRFLIGSDWPSNQPQKDLMMRNSHSPPIFDPLESGPTPLQPNPNWSPKHG